MTRETDVRVDKQIRGLLASEVPNSVLVSLHFNRDRTRSVRGLETYAMTPMGVKSSNDSRTTVEAGFGFQGNLRDNASLALAAAVHSQIIHRTGCEDRGVRRARFAVSRTANARGFSSRRGTSHTPRKARSSTNRNIATGWPSPSPRACSIIAGPSPPRAESG